MKKRNPQDSTRRNVQAANKALAALALRVTTIEKALRARKILAAMLGLFLVGAGCASLPLKERAVRASQATGIALGAADDFERTAFQTHLIPTLETKSTCGQTLSPPAPPDCTVHQKIRALFSLAFDAQIRSGHAIQQWRAGDPKPASIAEFAQIISDMLVAIGQATAGTPAAEFKAKTQKVLDEQAKTSAALGGV